MKQEEPIRSPDQLNRTAMDILTAYADVKGWVTAQAGRPDVHRAGNSILRALAEGRIGWAFWPPDSTFDEIASVASGEGVGIWIPRGDVDGGSEEDPESEEEDVDDNGNENDTHSTRSEDEDSELDDVESDGGRKVAGLGRFDVLAIDDEQDEKSDGWEILS